MMSDLIDRQAAIDELVKMLSDCFYADEEVLDAVKTTLKELPPALREQHHDEWCTDCKEYDHENSCCPRWTKVIRQTRRELQDEFVMTAVDGTLWVTVDDVQKVGRVVVDEDKSKFCRQFYMDAKPEQRTGKWIPQDHNKRVGNISTCVYYYPTCSECGKVGNETYKYCPHCGAKMISEGKTCDCYCDGTCTGTKEIDPCSCGGDKSKCDFYDYVREGANNDT